MSQNGEGQSSFAARVDGTFEIGGRMTFQTVPELVTKTAFWLNDTNGPVTIDLAKVSLADSAGVALLLDWLEQARVVERRLTFVNFPQQVKQLIRVSGLDDVFGIA